MTTEPEFSANEVSDEQRFRLVVANVRDYAIYLLDPAGYISSWNAGAERFKGYKEQEIIGSHFSRFYTPEDRAAGMPARALETALREGKFEAEGWRVRKDGTRFWASVVIDPVRNEKGELVGFAKITRDLTEKRRADEALAEANAALFQAQKMEAVGQLTGGVAHDFNNLLAVISNGLDVLSLRLQAHGDIKLVATMRRAVDRGAKLTQQLLAFARQQPLKVERCDLNALIRGFEVVLRRVGSASITFELELGARMAQVEIDAARFEAALLNLAVNARDAMPDGGKLTITTSNHTQNEGEPGKLAPGTYVQVSVTDTGTGMAPEVAARAFEPFFTTKEVGRGTGLGLSQVYGFIAQSGGDARIQSAVGAGTTITMFLPVISDEGQDGDGKEQEEAGTAETVLVVDDESDLLDIAAELFRSLGYDVLTAVNGEQAAELINRRDDISILFTDVVMPGQTDGIALARLARARRPNMKIILASGYPLPALRAAHGELGEFTFLDKPYRMADLIARLNEIS